METPQHTGSNRPTEQEALNILGFKHSSDIQLLVHDYRHIVNSSDVINVVRFLTEKGYVITRPKKLKI